MLRSEQLLTINCLADSNNKTSFVKAFNYKVGGDGGWLITGLCDGSGMFFLFLMACWLEGLFLY